MYDQDVLQRLMYPKDFDCFTHQPVLIMKYNPPTMAGNPPEPPVSR